MKLVLITVAVVLLAACSQAQDLAPSPQPVAGPLSVRASGEVASRESAVLGPPTIENIWNYTIAFMAPEGSAAQPGMPVLRFETQELQNRLIEKQAELEKKRSELERALLANTEALADLDLEIERLASELDKSRQKAALPESVLAKQTWQEHQLRHRLAQEEHALTVAKRDLKITALKTEETILRGDVSKLEREVAELESSIAAMNVTAPRAGMVVHLRRWGREKLSVGDQVWMGMRVIELPDLEQLVLELEVAERDLNRVEVGQPIRFTVDASPDVQFTGRVESLGRVVRTRSANQPAMVIDALAAIDAPDPQLMRPGMRVSAEIVLDEARL